MTENFSVETETAKTVKEMRARDPAFDMIKFLRALKQDVKPVIQVRASHKCYLQCSKLSSGMAVCARQSRHPGVMLEDCNDTAAFKAVISGFK